MAWQGNRNFLSARTYTLVSQRLEFLIEQDRAYKRTRRNNEENNGACRINSRDRRRDEQIASSLIRHVRRYAEIGSAGVRTINNS